MKVSSQLKEASVENLGADPANKPNGRLWLNTNTNKLKVAINGVVLNVLTLVDTISTAMIGDNQITTAKMVDASITTPKIADGAITQAKRAPLNKVVSAAVRFTTSSAVAVDVTNLTVTITTSGRPVILMLKPKPTGGGSIGLINGNITISGSGEGTLVYLRDGNPLDVVKAIGAQPAGSFLYLDEAPPAGEHVYKIQASQNATSMTFHDICLCAVEL